MEHGANSSEIEQLWRKPSIEEFMLSAAGQIRDSDHFAPWQFLMEVCTSPSEHPVSDFSAPPLWRHHPSSPARTVFVSDSCLTAYDFADSEIVLVAKKKGYPRCQR